MLLAGAEELCRLQTLWSDVWLLFLDGRQINWCH